MQMLPKSGSIFSANQHPELRYSGGDRPITPDEGAIAFGRRTPSALVDLSMQVAFDCM